ncbi:MAG: nucleotide sugar dehydrogenase [Candidatus Omnitrophica bacterium]|nr:nucleotide sugar dehydrogenase [Candidatus Omnitrophota bacterium]
MENKKQYDVCIVGGAGHVGLPLAIVFAHKGMNVLINDINEGSMRTISEGRLPFMEHDAEPLLKKALKEKRLSFSSDPADVAKASTVVITIGTPVDEFLNPVRQTVKDCLAPLLPHLFRGGLLVLRSTVFPGMTTWLDKYLKENGKEMSVAFCPERIVQGYAIKELQNLPQIISGTTPGSEEKAAELFGKIAPSLVRLSPIEAEFAKLFSNAYRYIQFAATNQFFMMANSAGVDYHKVLEGIKQDYPRASNIPGPGFAAGPCLFKDTMQLAAFNNNNFSLGHAAMLVNEGLPLYLVEELSQKCDLEDTTVGLLGMAFKADSDDVRSSLSYKLKKLLAFRAKGLLMTDPHVTTDPSLVPLEEVISKSDVLVLCAPHKEYKDLDLKGKPILDVWGFLKQNFLTATV